MKVSELMVVLQHVLDQEGDLDMSVHTAREAILFPVAGVIVRQHPLGARAVLSSPRSHCEAADMFYGRGEDCPVPLMSGRLNLE